jgi:putative membrane protein
MVCLVTVRRAGRFLWNIARGERLRTPTESELAKEPAMNTPLFLAASLAVLSLAACNDSKTPAGESTVTADAEIPPAVALTPAQEFANKVAASDMFEIEVSRLAQAKASSEKTKRFAEEMVKAHTDSTAKLKAAAGGGTSPIAPVTKMNEAQRQVLIELGEVSGAGFDEAYARAQVNAHQQTLDALKAYSGSGEDVSLKAFAAEMVPIVTAHLNMAKAL